MTFSDFIRNAGVIPPDALREGAWQRCATLAHPRKKNASVKLSEDGEIGWVVNFETATDPLTWRPEKEALPAPAVDPSVIRAKIERDRREAALATQQARALYESSSRLSGGHPYLAKKHLTVQGCQHFRVDKEGWLVIPMMNQGHVISVQRISPEGEKLFFQGAPTKGASFTLDRPGGVKILCEGIATGLTLYTAIPTSSVTMCFSAKNLVSVAKSMQVSGRGVVAADNDHKTAAKHNWNPGVDAAKEAAAILGFGVAVPAFDSTDDGTDWNDWFVQQFNRIKNLRLTERFSEFKCRGEAEALLRMEVLRNVRFSLNDPDQRPGESPKTL